MRKLLRQIVFYAGLLAIWELVVLLKLWPPYLFPTPYSVFESLRSGFSDHSFWIGIGVSMKRVADRLCDFLRARRSAGFPHRLQSLPL